MYIDLRAVYDRNSKDIFVMAVSHLLDIGFKAAKSITDEQIATIKDQGWATDKFLQNLVKLSREIANACESNVELIQFCVVEDVFDTEFYAGKYRISWERMSEIATRAIDAVVDGNDYWEEDLEDVDFTNEEREYFCLPLKDEEDDEDEE